MGVNRDHISGVFSDMVARDLDSDLLVLKLGSYDIWQEVCCVVSMVVYVHCSRHVCICIDYRCSHICRMSTYCPRGYSDSLLPCS